MADTFTTAQYVEVKNQDNILIPPGPYSAESSDDAVASIGVGINGAIAVIGQSAGGATITVTRIADGAVASRGVTVTALDGPPELPPFSVTFGDPLPRG